MGVKRNAGHSAFQRLLNMARTEKQNLNPLLARYATERLLYRLSISRHKNSFVLKGASMFLVWKGQNYRTTRDLDLLAFGPPGLDRISNAFTEVSQIRPEVEDGMVYLAETLRAAPIREEQEYDGIRVNLEGRLHHAHIPLQIDVGFGDAVIPGPEPVVFPSLLGMPAPVLTGYSRYSVVAEKFEAMVRLGIANSRMKDFYDIWLMSGMFDFDGATLCEAVSNTFARRRAPIPEGKPVAFTEPFFADVQKQAQWAAFVKKAQPEAPPQNLQKAVEAISGLIMPVLGSLNSGSTLSRIWIPKQEWQHSV